MDLCCYSKMSFTQNCHIILASSDEILPHFSSFFHFVPLTLPPSSLKVPILIKHTHLGSSILPFSWSFLGYVSISLALLPWSRLIDLPISRSIHYVLVNQKSHTNGRTQQEISTQISSSWSNNNHKPALLSAQWVSRGKSWESFLFFEWLPLSCTLNKTFIPWASWGKI